jgi:pimeloyl-ACP methyl ester carboxylesterase
MLQEVKEHYLAVNGAELCWFEWGQANSEPTILLVHATGFHARCWDQVIVHLEDRHVIAVDQRGHGRSSKDGPVPWQQYGEDLVAFIEALDLSNIVLAGHSMGGYCATVALAQIQDRVSAALLVDPVIFSPDAYLGDANKHDAFLNESNEHPVARRRNHFVDAAAMYDNFEGRGSYASWTHEALHDYCQWGLLPDEENGGFKLACPPVIEASIYMGSQHSPLGLALDNIEVPVTILRAQQRAEDSTELDFTKSPTWPELANQFGAGRDVYLPELTHFMPMQQPELVADYILGKL